VSCPVASRRYDHSRDSLDRNAAYAVAAYLGAAPAALGAVAAGSGWRQVKSVSPASPLWPSAAVSPRTALSTK
jgi:hypothetical protein